MTKCESSEVRSVTPPPQDLPPLPPTPVAESPGSSLYTSPLHSPDSNFEISPLAVKKPANESRFSLKQLTRSLTKKLVRSPEKIHDEELQEFASCFSCVRTRSLGQEQEDDHQTVYFQTRR